MCARKIKEVNYCLRCGNQLLVGQHFGGIRPACPACGWVYFADPKVAVAAIIMSKEKILLVRRSNNPQQGLWTLPAGFVDAGEDPLKALERECLEETGLQVKVTELLDVFFGQEHERGAHILIAYFAEVCSGTMAPGDDADRIGYFPFQNLPPLAFQTTLKIIRRLNHLKN